MPDERYLVSARKYRPERFGDLVAQDHVSNTLRNALIQDRLAHAYLFSGPRGVGKTTAARILARAINCETPLGQRSNGEPCGECAVCESFEKGRNLNIIEIDAASNNSVDDVRALREKVRIPPQGTKKKVYIIDEVHMLSNQAFNALLKTLEEPPPHVLFIFATTEPQKVLPTILSRCQRFDFHRIPLSEIVERLQYICREENVSYDEESLMLIAKKGNGALRDSLSVFDQAISLCGTTLQYDELARALGVVDVDLFFEVTDLIQEQDSAGMIELVARIMARGHDLMEFLGGLAEHLRNLLVAHTTGSTDLVQASQDNKSRYARSAKAFREPDLLRLLMIASDTESEIKDSTQPRLQVELALLKMAHLERTANLEQLFDKIERLEQMAEDGDLPGDISSTPETGTSSGQKSSPDEETSSTNAAASMTSQDSAASSTTTQSTESSSPKSPRASRSSSQTQTESSDRSTSPDSSNPASRVLGPPALKNRRKSSSASSSAGDPPSGSYDTSENTSTETATAVAEPPPEVSEEANAELERILQVWDSMCAAVKEERKHLGSLLDDVQPAELHGDRLQIRVPRAYYSDTLSRNKRLLQSKLQELLASDPPQIVFVVDENLNKNRNGEPSADADPFQHVEQLREEDPVIKEIFNRFGGEFVYE